MLVAFSATQAVAYVPFRLIERMGNECRFREALELADSVSPASHEQAALDILKARLLVQLDSEGRALALLSKWKTTAGKEERTDVWLLLALVHAGRGRVSETGAALKAARALGADEAISLGVEGLAAGLAGRIVDAERLLLAALRKDPTLTGALYNLACLRASQGRLAESAALVRASWHLGERDVRQLRSDPCLKPLRHAERLIDDLLATPATESHCGTW